MGLFGKKKKEEDGEEKGDAKISLEFRQSWIVRLGEDPDSDVGIGVGVEGPEGATTKEGGGKKKSKTKKKRDDKTYVIKHIDRDDLDEDRTFAMLFKKIEQTINLKLQPPKVSERSGQANSW